MPVQKNVDIVRRLIGRNVLKTEFQSTADKIDDQWPFEIAVAISAHVSDSGSNRAKLIENAFHTNISKVPDFICIFCHLLHAFWQTVVRVRQDENSKSTFAFFRIGHVETSLAIFKWISMISFETMQWFTFLSLFWLPARQKDKMEAEVS